MKKFGNFLVLIGFFLLALFALSYSAHKPEYSLIIAGFSLFFFGILVRSRAKQVERTPSGRFRTFNRIFGRQENKEGQPGTPQRETQKK